MPPGSNHVPKSGHDLPLRRSAFIAYRVGHSHVATPIASAPSPWGFTPFAVGRLRAAAIGLHRSRRRPPPCCRVTATSTSGITRHVVCTGQTTLLVLHARKREGYQDQQMSSLLLGDWIGLCCRFLCCAVSQHLYLH